MPAKSADLAGISLLAIFPAMRLPSYTPGELSVEEITSEASFASLLKFGSFGRRG